MQPQETKTKIKPELGISQLPIRKSTLKIPILINMIKQLVYSGSYESEINAHLEYYRNQSRRIFNQNLPWKRTSMIFLEIRTFGNTSGAGTGLFTGVAYHKNNNVLQKGKKNPAKQEPGKTVHLELKKNEQK